MPDWIRITRFELLLVAFAILAMAAIVLPVSRCELEDARVTIASEELQRWGEAVHAYLVDHGEVELPEMLQGPGPLPDDAGEPGDSLEQLLAQPRLGDAAHRPYFRHAAPDPWGRAYVVISAPGVPRQACWILTAGRNGKLETNARSLFPEGDDLGLHLR